MARLTKAEKDQALAIIKWLKDNPGVRLSYDKDINGYPCWTVRRHEDDYVAGKPLSHVMLKATRFLDTRIQL